MLDFDDAFMMTISAARTMPTEKTTLFLALGRILAEDVFADVDMPRFDRAAMDGFACQRADLAQPLNIVETVLAGAMPKNAIKAGTCSKIMTGAPVPQNADVVFPVEDSEQTNDHLVRFVGETEKLATNIDPLGHDMKTGDLVFRKGTRLLPQHIAMLASVGKAEFLVYARPVVGIIATGSEIIDCAKMPTGAQVRNSNSYELFAQVLQMGALPKPYGIVDDTKAALTNVLNKAFSECNVVLISGGVSMGEADFVPEVLRECGVTLHFDSIAMRPGKPTKFGTTKRNFVFGIPGNPVTAFVVFELLVKPFLYEMMGHRFEPPTVYAPMAQSLTREVARRRAYYPICFDETGKALVIEYHGSGHSMALARAQGLICLPRGCYEVAEDFIIPIHLLS